MAPYSQTKLQLQAITFALEYKYIHMKLGRYTLKCACKPVHALQREASMQSVHILAEMTIRVLTITTLRVNFAC